MRNMRNIIYWKNECLYHYHINDLFLNSHIFKNLNRNWVIWKLRALAKLYYIQILIATKAQKQMCTYDAIDRHICMLCIICIYVADIAADSEVYMMRRSATIVLHDWIAQNSRAMHELNKPTKAHIFCCRCCWCVLCAVLCATVRCGVALLACLCVYGTRRRRRRSLWTFTISIHSAYICVHICIYVATTKKHTYTYS